MPVQPCLPVYQRRPRLFPFLFQSNSPNMSNMRGLAVVVVVLILGMVCCTPASPQTVTIRLLNAKSGKPMPNKNVIFIWCPDCFAKSEVSIGKDGIGHVAVPAGTNTLSMMGGPKIGNEPYRIAFIECNNPAAASIPIAQVLEKGVVPQNTCSTKSFPPKPGEIVFWALPIPWWRPDFQ